MNYAQWSSTVQFIYNSNNNNGFSGFITGYDSAGGIIADISIPCNQTIGWYHLKVLNQNTNQWIYLYNALEVDIGTFGCTDSTAYNYDSLSTCDDGSCIPYIYGCTDSAAYNYDPTVNMDNGSCQYCNLSISQVLLVQNSSVTACDGWIYANTNTSSPPVSYLWSTGSTQNNITSLCSGVYTLTVTDAVGCTTDSTFTIGLLGCVDPTALNYNPNAVWDDGTCIYNVYGCTDSTSCNYNLLATIDDGSCNGIVGCTDSLSVNYNPLASCDDSSCFQCDLSFSVLSSPPSSSSICDGWVSVIMLQTSYLPVTYLWNTGSNQSYILNICSGVYTITVTDAYGCSVDTTINVGNVVLGCTDSTATNYDPTATVDDGSCMYPVYGCMDSTALNYNPLATIDDGTCTYCVYGCTDLNANNYNSSATCDDGSCIIISCGPITGVYMSDVIHDRATFNWDNMNSQYCQVDQLRFRYREVGTNSWSMKTMGVPVGSGCNTSNTDKLVLGLTSNTTYEYDFKLWYCNASTVNWHANGSFITAPSCDNVINVTPTPITTTKTEFCWDSVSTYSFVRLKYREDVPGSSFSSIGGFGVFSPTLCKNKNGLTAGTDYRVMWRTWCSSNGGPYRSPIWDGPVLWTQPTSIRLDEESTIQDLSIYPNPSRDVFNVEFVSENKQTIEVRIVNLVGEVIFTEHLIDFEGEYTHQFNLSEYSKGIYLLELDTDNGIVNKKLILQ